MDENIMQPFSLLKHLSSLEAHTVGRNPPIVLNKERSPSHQLMTAVFTKAQTSMR